MAFTTITNAAVAAGAALTTALMTAIRDNIQATFGGMPFLEKQTLSGQSSVNFDLIDSSLYDGYLVRFYNVKPTTDNASLFATLSTDGGASYLTIYDYAFIRLANQGSVGELDGNNQTVIQLANGVGSAAIENGASGDMTLYAPHVSGNRMHGTANISYTTSANSLAAITGAYKVESESALNNIKFQFSTGNFESGEIAIFGIRNAQTA